MSSPNTEHDMSYPSICIPRTFSNITWLQVKTVFEKLFGAGTIDRVDVARKTTHDGNTFNCMFIHFTAWPESAEIQEVRQKLLAGKTIKIVYDDPWYWKCSMSRLPRPEKRYLSKRAFIVRDPSESSQVLPKPTLKRSTGVEVEAVVTVAPAAIVAAPANAAASCELDYTYVGV